MRTLRRYGLFLLALPVLVLLFLRSQVANPDELNRTVDAARRLRELDGRIDIAVLEAHAGLSLDYDTLTQTFREMQRLASQIAESPSGAEPRVATGLARTREHIQKKEALVESFQSSNSVLRNSASFFAVIAAEAADGEPAVASLLTSVFLCSVDCNAEVIARIRTDIARVAALPRGPKTRLLLEHARVFVTLAPRVNYATHELSTMGGAPYDELYRALRDGREASIARANLYRIGLIALAAALLVSAVSMFWRLRRALQDLATLNETLEARVADRTRELAEIEAELRQAQKLESLGRISAGVAHEINTPVQFVSDSVHYLKEAFTSLASLIGVYRRTSTSDEARAADERADTDYALENVPAALDSALEGLARIATIVKSLKEFSHPDKSEKSAIDLNANIRSTVTIATNEYKHVADVNLDLGELDPVTCHGGEINQVVLNLIVNAAHAIGDVAAKTRRRGRIDIRTWQDANAAYVSVTDTGGGIPESIRHQIFDPFFTTKEVGKGTGQGLALARRIVVGKHDGELSFETSPGQGTTFLLKLPSQRLSALRLVA